MGRLFTMMKAEGKEILFRDTRARENSCNLLRKKRNEFRLSTRLSTPPTTACSSLFAHLISAIIFPVRERSSSELRSAAAQEEISTCGCQGTLEIS
jgi:hypothetical protein